MRFVDSGRRFAVTQAGVPAGTLVCCEVGRRQYAFDSADVRFIVRAERMRQVGGRRADGFVGTLQAETGVPVYALSTRLEGLPATITGSHIIVTAGARESIGWLVEGAVRSARHTSDVLPLPAIAGPAASIWFKGLVMLEDEPTLMLSPADLDPTAQPRRVDPAPARPAAVGGAAIAAPSLIVFSSPALPLCPLRFALSARQVAGLERTLPVVPLPASPRHLSGVARWRDAAVPILDFRARAARASDSTRLRYLVACCGPRLFDALVAFPVASDVVMHRIASDDTEMPVTLPSGVLGVFRIGHEAIALLDVDELASGRVNPAALAGLQIEEPGTAASALR